MFKNSVNVYEIQRDPAVSSQGMAAVETCLKPAGRPERVKFDGRYVTLEPLAAEHIAALWPLAEESPGRWQWLSFGPFHEFTTFKIYGKLIMASQAEMLWCVRPHDETGAPGAPAGWAGLLDIQSSNAAIELGNIWFSDRLARTRAATETLALLLGYVFDDLGYRRVAWKCNALNDASRRCAARLGFSFEGILRAHMIVRGTRRDSAYYSLLAEEWPARRAALGHWLEPSNFDTSGHQIDALERAA